jgi:hypothetical protein
MALETGTVINDLVITNPTAVDAKSQGDDHLRLLKTTIKNSFPGFTGAVIAGGISTGVTNAYLLSAALQAYTVNTIVVFTPNIANTGNSTININGLGIVGITRTDGAILTTNDLIAGQYIEMLYNGTEFRLLNVTKNYVDNLSFSSSLPAQTGNSGKVITTDGTTAAWTDALSLLSLSLATALPIASGGTNAITAPLARASLGAAASGANSDITSLTGLTTPLAVVYGGIGSTTSAGAPFALKGANSDITSLTGLTTPLAVAYGGTGVTTSTGTGSNVLSASPTFTGNTTASFVRGEFRKDAPTAVAFTVTAAFAVSTQTQMYIDVNGTCLTFASGTVVSMPSAVTGTDYAIWAETAGTLTCTNNFTTPPTANARKIGGFHYAPGGNAAARSGGNTTPYINAYSLWDLKFKPACQDPRGMTLVADNFWADIYLLNTDPDTNGTSKYNVTIADGASPPKVPTKFGGNGTTTYTTLTWWEANEVLAANGKRSASYQEYAALAFGTTEASAIGTDQVSTILNAV